MLYVFVGAVDDLIKDPPIRLAVNVNVNVSYNEKKNPKIHTKYCCRFHKIKPKKPGLFDAISNLT